MTTGDFILEPFLDTYSPSRETSDIEIRLISLENRLAATLGQIQQTANASLYNVNRPTLVASQRIEDTISEPLTRIEARLATAGTKIEDRFLSGFEPVLTNYPEAIQHLSSEYTANVKLPQDLPRDGVLPIGKEQTPIPPSLQGTPLPIPQTQEQPITQEEPCDYVNIPQVDMFRSTAPLNNLYPNCGQEVFWVVCDKTKATSSGDMQLISTIWPDKPNYTLQEGPYYSRSIAESVQRSTVFRCYPESPTALPTPKPISQLTPTPTPTPTATPIPIESPNGQLVKPDT